jgi:hypothetical protein
MPRILPTARGVAAMLLELLELGFPLIGRFNAKAGPICPVCGVDALESDLLDIGERSLAGYLVGDTFSCLVCAWTGPVPEAEEVLSGTAKLDRA